MNKNLSEIVFIIDKIGSVHGLEKDTLGGAVHHIGNIHKYARPEDVPGQTLFIITTDGLENASRYYNLKKVREMIAKKKKDGWQFIFLGTNIDAVKTAGAMGLDEDMTADLRQAELEPSLISGS